MTCQHDLAEQDMAIADGLCPLCLSAELAAQPGASPAPQVGDDLRERFAALAHEMWSGWMRYMFGKMDWNILQTGKVMHRSDVERWTRQMNTLYDDLPEKEKESDRVEADKMLAIVAAAPTLPADVHYPTPNQIKWLRDANEAGYDPVLTVQVLREKVMLLEQQLSAQSALPADVQAADGAELIAQERKRQISKEGYSPEHDDGHKDGELARAAACYAIEDLVIDDDSYFWEWWPWDEEWWKPQDRLSNLVRAGALIAAEIDRLQRAALTAGKVTK